MYYDKTPLQLMHFEVDIVSHCNLNCALCDHFSPLAKKTFLDLDVFKKEMARMSELFDGTASHIAILGGEPTLHKDVEEFLRFTRNCFPQTEIQLFTNGLTLRRLPDSFWQRCAENRIILFLTRYPFIREDGGLERFITSHGVQCKWSETNPIKIMTHMPLDLSGSQDIKDSFSQCFHANRCIQLKHGRLYPCPIAPAIEHFNSFFDKQLELSPADSINIYGDVTKEQIFEFLASPIPFCRYCDVKRRTPKPWTNSTRKIDEWV